MLAGTSIETPTGEVSANGFLLDMWRVFEDFVTVAFREQIEPHYGGRIIAQQRHHLDEAGQVELRPDILWQERGFTRAVIDAKYTTKSRPDHLYQLLAYCTTLGLTSGHLVYAAGATQQHTVRRAGIQITCHTLNLNQPPTELLRHIRALAHEICLAPEPRRV